MAKCTSVCPYSMNCTDLEKANPQSGKFFEIRIIVKRFSCPLNRTLFSYLFLKRKKTIYYHIKDKMVSTIIQYYTTNLTLYIKLSFKKLRHRNNYKTLQYPSNKMLLIVQGVNLIPNTF